ncbi:MAG: tocopherol cyclase family protein [Prolixibacteraceae bacterium]|nr:tocopherol cyclase family protein [Prolixibacteraceae bacterium]
MKKIRIPAFIISILICCTIVTAQAQHLEKPVSFIHYKCTPFYNFKKIGNTEIFRGNNKKKKYFEGWYFKMVSDDESRILSVIPGISLSKNGKEQHAFIQLIDGTTAQTQYFTYPISDFSFSRKEFAIKIADNYFSKNKIILNLKDSISQISGQVEMHDLVDFKPNSFMNPGIMGWYRFVPFMQCYHGVVSLTHRLKGELRVNNEQFNFTKGKGYIEKDWGKSMPSSWIWMQSNHFADTTSSFMLSIADVPWLGKSFTGFLGFFYHNNEVYRFATYRNSKLTLEIAESDRLIIRIENRKNAFIIEALSNTTGMLKAPDKGSMDRRIPESIDATLKVTMKDKNDQVIFIDSTNIAGLEMVGDFKKFESGGKQ